jgi:hypothetical protein
MPDEEMQSMRLRMRMIKCYSTIHLRVSRIQTYFQEALLINLY